MAQANRRRRATRTSEHGATRATPSLTPRAGGASARPSAAEAPPREQVEPAAWVALALSTLAFTVCFSVWGLLSPLAPFFREQFGLSGAQTGLLVGIPVVLGSVARIPLGMLADQFGGRVVLSALLVFLTVPLVLAGLTTSYGALVAVAFLLGIGGAGFAAGVPFVSRWFPPGRQGLALGIIGIGTIGATISTWISPLIADAFGWQFAFWVLVPAVLVMGAVMWVVGREAPVRKPAGSLAARLAPLKSPSAWMFGLFYFITFGSIVAITVYLPTLLVDTFGLERGDAARRTAIFLALATVVRPFGGMMADRWGGAPVLNGTFLTVALLAIVLAFEPGMAMTTVAFLAIAACLGLGNGAVLKLVAEVFPNEVGAVSGLVGAAGGLGGFFPPILMGAVYDVTGSYAIGFMLLSEVALGCLVVNVLALQQRASAWMPSR